MPAFETEIPGATELRGILAASYILTDDDVGSQVKARMRFLDDRSNLEEFVSALFPASGTILPTVTPPPPPPPPSPPSRRPPPTPPGNFPTADAGPDQLGVWEGALVTLDGSGSSDPDDDPLRYRWNQLSGEPVVLSSQNIVNPTFTARRG